MEYKMLNVSLSNLEIREKLLSLQPVLAQRNVIGYIAARNNRILSDALIEYTQFEREAILELGSPDIDENGNPTGSTSIKPNTEAFKKFICRMEPILRIKQDITIMIAKFSEAVGVLSGEEILAIDWMLED